MIKKKYIPKHTKKSNGKKRRIFVTMLAVSLVIFSMVGSTLAWLVAKTETVKNTFTYGDINIELTETDTNKDGDNNPNTNQYPMMPGETIKKDPRLTVLKNSEASWLFVKVEKSSNFDDFMEYEMANGWDELSGEKGVFYRKVDKLDQDIVFDVIKDNDVKVKGDVTKEMLNELDANGAEDYPTLTFTGYAVQRDKNIDNAKLAWEKVTK